MLYNKFQLHAQLISRLCQKPQGLKTSREETLSAITSSILLWKWIKCLCTDALLIVSFKCFSLNYFQNSVPRKDFHEFGSSSSTNNFSRGIFRNFTPELGRTMITQPSLPQEITEGQSTIIRIKFFESFKTLITKYYVLEHSLVVVPDCRKEL